MKSRRSAGLCALAIALSLSTWPLMAQSIASSSEVTFGLRITPHEAGSVLEARASLLGISTGVQSEDARSANQSPTIREGSGVLSRVQQGVGGSISFSPPDPVMNVVEPGYGNDPPSGYAQNVTLQNTSSYPMSFTTTMFQTSVRHGQAVITFEVFLQGSVNLYVRDGGGGHLEVLTANCPMSPATLPANGNCQTILAFAGSSYGTWSGAVTVSGTTTTSPPLDVWGTMYPTAFNQP